MAYTTKQSLLEAIRSNSEISWQEFYNTYRPLIVFFAKRENLSLEEIEDLVQTVMVKVFKMQETFRYDKSQGRFRDYLGTVIHNAIVDLYRAKRRSLDYAAMEMANVPGIDSFEKIWCKEWQNHVFEQALIQVQNTVQETTFQAFQLSVLEQRPVQEVADFLQISVQNVYEAKSRCIAQLRKKAKVLAEED
ncbi:MAG: sigma-70 family RNA polymerase sigma factor [Lentisphaeria bacterium]|nr:sigma-70 family RNA polymerase sigma factor [Lentisphaeria bacterium]